MRENTLKQRLYAGKATFGVMCTFPSPPVVEMLGYLGFDWILLDNEPGSITVDTALRSAPPSAYASTPWLQAPSPTPSRHRRRPISNARLPRLRPFP
jgi:2-keto-3-deoxy-L-rhamnonate aldolase RhmA